MRATRRPVVSVALDTSGGRAYIHGMAITPNEGGRDLDSIKWNRKGSPGWYIYTTARPVDGKW